MGCTTATDEVSNVGRGRNAPTTCASLPVSQTYAGRCHSDEGEAMLTRWTRRPRGSAIVAAIGLLIAVALGPATGLVVHAADPLAASEQHAAKRDVREVLRGGLRMLASDRLGNREHRTNPGGLITRGGRFGARGAVPAR